MPRTAFLREKLLGGAVEWGCGVRLCGGVVGHTPSIAFRHRPPNSARTGYATEGALFISAQLSTDAVSALRKVWVKDVVNQCLEFESGHR